MDHVDRVTIGALQGLVRGRPLPLPIVQAVWRRAAGDLVARASRPTALTRNGRLVVAVADARWRTELDRLVPALLEKMNEALGRPAVQKIQLIVPRAGLSSPGPDEPVRAADAATPPTVLSQELLDAAAAIADGELRELFVRAAARQLALRGERHPKS